MTNWKQPVPVNIYHKFDEDHLARDLYLHLLLRSCNKDMDAPKQYQGAFYQLKRGDVIFGSREYSKLLRCSVGAIHDCMKRLEKLYSLVNSAPTPRFTIVSIKNYDTISSFEQPTEQKVNSNRTVTEPSKSVKNDKSVKDIINTILKFEQKRDELIEAAKNKYPNKNAGKAFDDMLEYSKIHGKVYKDWSLAYLKWVREDTYKKYNLVTEYGEMIPWAD